MRKTAALLLLALMSSGCRNRNERVTSIDVTSPLQHKRLLRGFGSIYTGWRATNRVFAVALDRPPITDTATFLEMSFRAPLEDLGPARQLRVTVRANGIDACGETIQDAEWHLLDCHIPEKALHNYLRREQARCIENGMRVSVIGRRDRLPRMLLPAIEGIERATAHCSTLHLRIAVDYSSRDAIIEAAKRLRKNASRESLSALLGGPDVDLLIRTGGEQRLSDFLLWECAYAEMVFTPRMWPDFDASDLNAAVAEFHSRERRFGAVPQMFVLSRS